MKIRFNIATNQLQVLGRQEQGYLKMQENPSERNMCGTEETPVSNKMTTTFQCIILLIEKAATYNFGATSRLKQYQEEFLEQEINLKVQAFSKGCSIRKKLPWWLQMWPNLSTHLGQLRLWLLNRSSSCHLKSIKQSAKRT